MKKESKIKCFLGFHNPLHCYRWSDIDDKDEREIDLEWEGIWAYQHRIIYPSPWSLLAIVETRYRCADCGRKFWYPRGDFEERKMYQRSLDLFVINSFRRRVGGVAENIQQQRRIINHSHYN